MKRMLTLVAIVAVVGVVATSGSAKPAKRSGPLHVTKQCTDPPYDGTVGSFCTITSSNIPAIEPGMRVVYLAAPDFGAGVLDADIAVGSGQGTALGHVVLDLSTASGRISLVTGTGKFRHLEARATVSVDDEGIWHWDGTYRFDDD
jgi:hypothetical protein